MIIMVFVLWQLPCLWSFLLTHQWCSTSYIIVNETSFLCVCVQDVTCWKVIHQNNPTNNPRFTPNNRTTIKSFFTEGHSSNPSGLNYKPAFRHTVHACNFQTGFLKGSPETMMAMCWLSWCCKKCDSGHAGFGGSRGRNADGPVITEMQWD